MRVKPSLDFSAAVAVTSAQIAIARNIQFFIAAPCPWNAATIAAGTGLLASASLCAIARAVAC
ncbi:putative RNA methylase [Xanthomonas arboricola]|uniref:hypothetical protein n=1 Tax=Xanthomonas arboricola TaxID=56448 RepID=UPI001431AED9|nr:hypothetical protein [Xanthomonas arboricola]NJC30728.1 putative RNA methylase [Xanthomonas arboricola]